MDIGLFPLVLLGAAAVMLAVMWLGFRVPARVRIPDLGDGSQALEKVPVPEGLPAPVERFYRAAFGEQVPVPRSVVMYGRGTFRVRKLPLVGFLWAPLSWTLHLAPGQAFVWQARVYWLRRMLVDGGDQYREGKGRFVMGKEVIEGDNLDYSEQVVLWLYTIYFSPGALLDLPAAAWHERGEHAAGLTVRDGGRELSFTLHFDPASGHLARIETQRPASKAGTLYPFQLVLSQPRELDSGVMLPSQMGAAWEDDFYTYYQVLGARYNAPAADVIQAGVG